MLNSVVVGEMSWQDINRSGPNLVLSFMLSQSIMKYTIPIYCKLKKIPNLFV